MMFQQPDAAQGAMLGQGDIQQAVPQMMPSGGSNMSPAGIPSLARRFDQMSLPQLIAEFNNPNSSAPRYALLSAINKAAERMRMQQEIQGQNAMAQNAQQGNQTVASGILAGAEQMAAHEAAPRFRHGGAVAFGVGGITYGYAPEYEEAEKYGIVLSPYDSDEVRQQKLAEVQKRAASTAAMTPREAEERRSAVGVTPRTPQEIEQFVGTVPGTSYQPETFTGPSRAPQAARPGAGLMGLPPKTAVPGIDISGLEQANLARQAELQGRKTLPTEITEGRKGLAALASTNIEANRKEAEDFANEAKARRDELMERANKSLLDDPRAALGLAAAIDPRRGQVFGSMAGGLDKILASRDALKDSAQKEYMAAQATSRQLQGNIRQMQMLELQRQQALTEGDYNRANQIQDQIDALKMDTEKTKVDMQKHSQDIYFKGRAADTADKNAQANLITSMRPTAQAEMYAQFQRDPAMFNRYMEAQQAKKNPYDTIMDNVRSEFKDWVGTMQGQTAKPEIQKAKMQEILDRHIQFARAMGLTVPKDLEQKTGQSGNKVIDFSSIK